MSWKIIISFIFFLIVALSIASFFFVPRTEILSWVVAVSVSMSGFFLARSARRNDAKNILSLLLMIAHGVVLLSYAAMFIYMGFFWSL